MALKKRLKESNKATSHLFNPLRRLRIPEPKHSELLGDLLRPSGTHGQGDIFLQALLRHLKVPDPEHGQWSIAIERENIDLCLRRNSPASVIVIESKSNWAEDQQNQLYRYWDRAIHTPHPGLDYESEQVLRNFQIVYLIPHRSKKPNPQTLLRPRAWDNEITFSNFKAVPLPIIPLTFGELFGTWNQECLPKIDENNVRLKGFLSNYQELWPTH